MRWYGHDLAVRAARRRRLRQPTRPEVCLTLNLHNVCRTRTHGAITAVAAPPRRHIPRLQRVAYSIQAAPGYLAIQAGVKLA